ncbi:protein DJ-1 homolog B-like isoform X3 [Actinidia eriantha]|uniref:protein DJ-1 homolog B-like isoform X3 n=1 Tax=Actinidia eriantha TaxID=165200 RepID=UPI0025909333|nr:protein DJ-1 homolog B-like isoform X3 [Actinidia eriantha]
MKLKEQAADGRFYAAICAAPAVALGSWGLLKEKKQLSSSAITFESRVQQDGKVVTSRGPGTAIEFSVVLVEQLSGKDKADEVSGPWTGFIHVAECKITCFLRDAKLGELTAQKQVICPNHGDEYDVLELNPMEWTFDNCPKILVPIADGTEEMEATMLIDFLRRAKAEVVVASVGDKTRNFGFSKCETRGRYAP